jgi:hypothetical protein
MGDVIVDLDANWRVAWAWSSFDHLDPHEAAVLNEICDTPANPGCPALTTWPGNDWTHTNSVGYSPSDGDLVISVRHIDAVFKIDYANGAGTGAVVWRLGRGGDFSTDSNDPWPWFSHQHDAHYDGPFFVLYDNGNTRAAELGASENSRGQVYLLDEVNRVAHLVYNFDLGAYSAAVGSAELLGNGNFHFDSGFLSHGTADESIEVTPSGQTSFALGGNAVVYRSFRVRSLYEP